MCIRIAAIIMFLLTAAAAAGSPRNDTLLATLDSTIAVKEDYANARKAKITVALANLATAREDQDLYNVYRTLYSLYRSFRGDSAMWVAEKRLEAATRLGDRRRITSATLNLAESYSLAGDYYHALGLLDTLSRHDMEPYHLKYLYTVYRLTYTRMAKADGVQSHRLAFEEKSRHYRDSTLTLVPDTAPEYLPLKAWQLMGATHREEAARVMKEFERRNTAPVRSSTKAQMARIYRNLRDTDSELQYLAEASIADLKDGVRDYSALMELAKLLGEEGDVERAYRYIRCALEDAYLCNAKSRTTEILELVPIIDAAYHENEQKRMHNLWGVFGIISLLAVALTAALWVAVRSLRANRAISRRLNSQNTQLAETNRRLSDANLAREKYISELFDAHSGYINRMGLFRKNVMRLMKASQYKEALDMVSSAQPESSELKELYKRFDTIFLSLYPRFISDFNAMVRENCRVNPDSASLTSELRVLALVRIGISSSSRIAELLHYTPQTVYNYRFAIRNALIVPKEEFDRKLIKMGL